MHWGIGILLGELGEWVGNCRELVMRLGNFFKCTGELVWCSGSWGNGQGIDYEAGELLQCTGELVWCSGSWGNG